MKTHFSLGAEWVFLFSHQEREQRMKRILVIAVIFGFVGTANAILIDRGVG